MLLLVLLCACQAGVPVSPPQQADEFDHPSKVHFTFGTDAAWWSTRFRAQVKEDGDLMSGTSIDLVHDLKLADERGIPIYGGGTITAVTDQTDWHRTELFLTAEYWARTWTGSTVLDSDQVLDDVVFKKGAPVDSHFRLSTLDLGVGIRQTGNDWMRGGASLLLHAVIGELRMQSGTQEKEVTVGDLTWGLGGFFEYRPWNILALGASLKGYLSFNESTQTTLSADVRVYAGVEWKFIRFETGFRYTPFTEGQGASETFRYDLYGPYVSLSAWISF